MTARIRYIAFTVAVISVCLLALNTADAMRYGWHWSRAVAFGLGSVSLAGVAYWWRRYGRG